MRGILVLIGGAEDKYYDISILKKCIKDTNTKSLAIIPTASNQPYETYSTYFKLFKNIGVENIECFNIIDCSDEKEYIRKLKTVDTIFFTGGDQVELINSLYDTSLLKKIKQYFYKNGLNIVGTSAGAVSVGPITIYDGDDKGFEKNSIRFLPAFNILKDIIIDSHFLNRNRIPRLVQFLISNGTYKKGIGIDEDTSIFIYPDNIIEVYGSGMVTMINMEIEFKTNYEDIEDKRKYSVDNINAGFLCGGTIFDLNKWSITIRQNDII